MGDISEGLADNFSPQKNIQKNNWIIFSWSSNNQRNPKYSPSPSGFVIAHLARSGLESSLPTFLNYETF
jgi:hypothetical protein